jgi:hypothetical protein
LFVAKRHTFGKNELLKRERGISFEEVVFHIENGDILEVIDHPNVRYLHQRVFVLNIDGYAYFVPFIETDDEIFLKTIFPSLKMTKKYLYEK